MNTLVISNISEKPLPFLTINEQRAYDWITRLFVAPLDQASDEERKQAVTTIIESSADSMEAAQIDEETIKAINEMDRYLDLRTGWDGYSGEPIEETQVRLTQSITKFIEQKIISKSVVIKAITPCPRSDGAIDVEYEFDNGFLTLSIEGDDYYLSIERDGRVEEIPLNPNKYFLGRDLARLVIEAI